MRFLDFTTRQEIEITDYIIGINPETKQEVKYPIAQLLTMLLVEYSVDGLTSWHIDYNSETDKFMRIKVGNNEWSSIIKISAKDGTNGVGVNAPLLMWNYSVDGNSWHDEYDINIDKYFRFSNDNGETWGAGIYFKGPQGAGLDFSELPILQFVDFDGSEWIPIYKDDKLYKTQLNDLAQVQ